MQGFFWSNTVWYVILSVFTIIMLVIVQVKADNRRFVMVFIAAVLGLLYLFEFTLVALADAYKYYPMIVPDDSFQDSVFGNIFSQTSITAACALIIVLRLKPIWYSGFAVTYYLIELLFIWLGIYVLHWYKTIFTPLILVPLFWAVRRWHNRAVQSNSEENEDALIFLGALAVGGNSVFLPLKLARIHVFTGGFFDDLSRDHTTTLVIYSVFFTGLLITVYRLRLRWYWKLLFLAGLYSLQYAAFKAGLMTFQDGWFPWATALEIGVCFLWINVLGWMLRARRPSADGLPK